MKNFKFNLAIVGFLTMLFVSIFVTSCTNDVIDSDVQLESIEQEHTATVGGSATVRTDCHAMYEDMDLTIPFANDECMNNAHTRLEKAISNYNQNGSDYNLYLVFNFWLNYYRTAVDCFGCEETDCESYVATGQQMIDCLASNESPYTTALQDIFSWVQGNCEECCGDCGGGGGGGPECCDESELIFIGVTQSWSWAAQKFCCFYEYEIEGGCGEFNKFQFEGDDPIDLIPASTFFSHQLCDGGLAIKAFDENCGFDTGWLDDNCNDECCANVSFDITQKTITNMPDCCNVRVELIDPDGCTEGWDLIQTEGVNGTLEISGPVIFLTLCDDTRQRVVNESCGIDTGWISGDCN